MATEVSGTNSTSNLLFRPLQLTASKGKRTIDKQDFINLLMTQLRYQDPTSPMDNQQFMVQLATFTLLEQVTDLGKQVSEAVQRLRWEQAVNLIGRQVTLLVTEGEQQEKKSGTVEKVVLDNNEVKLVVAGEYYGLEQVLTVQ